LDDLYDAYRRARRADGGNPCIGRELPGLLRRAGFSEVAVHVLAAHSQVSGDAAFLRAEGAGIPAQLVKSGYLAPETLDRLAREWRAMLAAPEHSMFRMLVAVSGVNRPAEDVEGQSAATPRPAVARRPLPAAAPQIPSNGGAALNVAALVIEALAREMNVAPEVLDPEMSLIQLGGDSLAAVGLCETLRERLSVDLSVAAVLSEKPLSALAAEVEERIRHR
jgi:acyl carrier protein